MWNPLGDLHASCRGAADHRDEAVARYSFAIPSQGAVDAIAARSPDGVVELGAGLGYWARILSNAGIDVTAYDIAPPPAASNSWYAGRDPWHPVNRGDVPAIGCHPERTLLLVWPTRNETWAADALALHHRGGGNTVAIVGEPPGGRTGDDSFQAMLGHLPECLACQYRSTGSACTCGIPELWSRVDEVELPRWAGTHDSLTIYVRATGQAPGPRGRRRFWWPGGSTRPRRNRGVPLQM